MVDGLPVSPRNGPAFCKSCGINYVRFILAFPLESLRLNLVMGKNASQTQGTALPAVLLSAGTFSRLSLKPLEFVSHLMPQRCSGVAVHG